MNGLNRLQMALLQADINTFAKVEADDDWVPSKEYETAIKGLIRKVHNPMWKYVNTVGKKAAVIVLAVIISFSAMMSVRAIREPVVEFFVNMYEKFTVLLVNNESTDSSQITITTKYTPTFIPDGYTLENITDDGIK